MATNRMRQYTMSAPTPSPHNVNACTPTGFAICPPQLVAAYAWQLAIYRLAYERALAETQVPRHHRTLFSVWN